MIALVQRVREARVEVSGDVVGRCGSGMLILLGVHVSDTETEASWLAGKCARLRIFEDDDGKMNQSAINTASEALVVSQFTLYGNANKGNRPSFIASARPELAEPLYAFFVRELEQLLSRPVETGVFGANMQVHLVNDGPVTLSIERLASD